MKTFDLIHPPESSQGMNIFATQNVSFTKAQGRDIVTSVEVWNEHSYIYKKNCADCEERFGVSEEIK